VALPVHRWQVDSAVLRLHGRRCTALEFHPVKARVTHTVVAWDLDKPMHVNVADASR